MPSHRLHRLPNPLSVKTKVHVPRSPTASMSSWERDKLFLEVHIQNLTQSPLWFEKIQLEPVDGWKVDDGNFRSSPNVSGKSQNPKPLTIFSGSVSGHATTGHPTIHLHNDTEDFGELESAVYPCTWCNCSPWSLGHILEIIYGRTRQTLNFCKFTYKKAHRNSQLTLLKVLSRRIPLLTAPLLQKQCPRPSALPPHLQKSALPPSRSRSPSVASQPQFPNRVSTPPLPPIPQRPASPFKRATVPSPLPSRPLSPGHGPEHALVSGAHRFGLTPPPPSNPGNLIVQTLKLMYLSQIGQPIRQYAQKSSSFLRLSLAVSANVHAERGQADGQPKRSRSSSLPFNTQCLWIGRR